jgi:hypothetical protein
MYRMQTDEPVWSGSELIPPVLCVSSVTHSLRGCSSRTTVDRLYTCLETCVMLRG